MRERDRQTEDRDSEREQRESGCQAFKGCSRSLGKHRVSGDSGNAPHLVAVGDGVSDVCWH